MGPIKYPTFQDKYGQMQSTDQTFEQNQPTEQLPPNNPWMQIPQKQEEPPPVQIELAPQQWEYKGK